MTQVRSGQACPGVFPEKDMDVRGDRCRAATALRNRGFGDRVVEAAAAMPDVEHHAAFLRIERGRQGAFLFLDDVGELAHDVRRARISSASARRRGSSVSRICDISSRRFDASDMAHHLRPGACELRTRAPRGAAAPGRVWPITLSDMRTLTPSDDIGVLRESSSRRLPHLPDSRR